MTAKEVVEILKAHGWTLDRIKGSHHTYTKAGFRPIPVPFHGNQDLGDFGKRILKEAGINNPALKGGVLNPSTRIKA